MSERKPKAPKDPEMAAAKLAVASSMPSMDLLVAKDPVELSDEELAAGVKHLRNERALWQLKEERKGKSRVDASGGEEDEEDKT